MIKEQPKRYYSFSAFRIDLRERVLFNERGVVPLTPKAFDTLLVLVENSHHVLTKEELMRRIWPDSFVEENNLAQNISLLRKVLSEEGGKGEKFIETVPKRGYRFIGDVRESVEDEPDLIIRERTRTRILIAEEADEASDDSAQGAPTDLQRAPAVIDLPPSAVSHEQPHGFNLTLERPPETMYARSGDVNIAYQVIGDAPLDLVFVMGWVSHLEYFWREPSFARFLMRLASFSRLILFDKRGTGLSDRVPIHELPTLEQRMDDVRAVMDAVGSERAALCGVSEGGPMCSLFAATYPEKTIALVMIGTYAKRLRDAEYPWAPTTEERQHFFEEIRAH
jgi:DNA-binding winged helix-turn-helix (wHTH) protein